MDESRSSVRGNISKIYVLSAIATFGFSVPIFVPFQQEHGLSLSQIFLLQAAYSLVLVIFEIPSGYIADLWGRRNTIIVGSFALFLGMLTYAVTSGFYGFLLAETFLGIGLSFQSGTMEALTFDTLAELEEEDRFLKVNGLQGFFALGSKALTSILVGFLAAASLRLPFWADVLLFGSATVVSFLLVEPIRTTLDGKQHIKAMWNICVNVLLKDKSLQAITLLYAIVAAIDVQLFWFLQAYQTDIGLPLAYFGVTYAVMCLLGAFAYREAHRFGKRAENPGTLLWVSFALILTCFGLGLISSIFGLAFFILEGMLFGLFDPISSNITNRLTTSDVRATVLSIRSLVSRFLFACLTPIIGYAADVISLSSALLLTGLIGLLAMVPYVFMARKLRRA